jgi:hypothetical protein
MQTAAHVEINTLLGVRSSSITRLLGVKPIARDGIDAPVLAPCRHFRPFPIQMQPNLASCKAPCFVTGRDAAFRSYSRR